MTDELPPFFVRKNPTLNLMNAAWAKDQAAKETKS